MMALALKTPLKILNNPGRNELRRLSQREETTTAYGAPAYFTLKSASRSASSTQMLADRPLGLGQTPANPDAVRYAEDMLEKILPQLELIQIDRVIGNNNRKTWHCRLLIPKEYARIALLWSETLFEASPSQRDPQTKPDFLTIDIPNWPEAFPSANGTNKIGPKGIFVRADEGKTYIFGTDYVGEVKMSFLRQAMYQMKKAGGLGLHAGSKILKLKNASGALENIGVLLFGLSGTGKTTLTLESHGLKTPEGIELLQDDIVWMTTTGEALGTEDNFYVKTEGVSKDTQPGIDLALLDPGTVFENVSVNEKSKMPEFLNFSRGTNGRALAIRRKIPGSSDEINLNKVHKIFFITRRDTIVPPVAKLTPRQAAAYFMLGESIETSAGDPTKAGQPKHEVGFNPFIIGREDEEGKRIGDIIQANSIECFLLNTGSLGKNGDQNLPPKKITQQVSSKIIEMVSRNAISWTKDSDWGYETAVKVPDLSSWSADYDPRRYYSSAAYQQLTQELKTERSEFLARYRFELPTN
ncbi:MAG: phosphoenolpyruvate carboxykinase [Elusimicrobia bacterium]|nr:phosphoenolpyruvate carboxykinase [Elusimicrobiota bacterium]